MKTNYKLLLADNHSIFRQGLKETLMNQKQFQFEIAECEDGLGVISFLSKNHVDLILLDINMPFMDGLEVLKKVRQEFKSDVPILMMTTHYNENFIFKSIEYDVTGYLLKYIGSEELLTAISKTLKKEKYYSEEIQKIISGKTSSFENFF